MKRIVRSSRIAGMLALLVGAGLVLPAGAQQNADGDSPVYRQPTVVESPNLLFLPPPAEPRDRRTDRARDEVAPMTPEEVRAFREHVQQRRMALHDGPPPDMRNRTHNVSMEPGSAIPEILIAPGFVSSIALVDRHGNPWPIVGQPAVGNPRLYQVTVEESDARNLLTVSGLSVSGASNVSISLAQQTVPLTIMLRTQTDYADLRSDVRIDGSGPMAIPFVATGSAVSDGGMDAHMMQFLDGVPPADALELQTSGGQFRVWAHSGALYLRTRNSIRSPRAEAVVHGTGGVRVYRMALTPVVLFSDQGAEGTLRITLPSRRAWREMQAQSQR